MTTKTTMTKEVLHQLAEAGVRQRLEAMQRELTMYHREWPDLFVGQDVPQLVKVPPKTSASSNGHWPAVTFTKKKNAKIAASWTPERRAAQGERLRARIAAGKGPKRKTSKKKSPLLGRRLSGGTGLVDRIHSYLKTHGESALKDLVTGSGGKVSANVVSTMSAGLKSGRFKRTAPGRYALGPKAE